MNEMTDTQATEQTTAADTTAAEDTEDPIGESDFLSGFDLDEEPDTTAEETPAPEAGQEEAKETFAEPETPAEPETIAYQYLQQNTALPLSAVRQVAEALGTTPEAVVKQLQKGGNYDHVAARVEQSRPYIGLLQRMDGFAAAKGLKASEVAEKMLSALEVVQSAGIAAELKEKYPEAPPELIQSLAVEQARREQNEKRSNAQAEQTEAAETQRRAAWVSFFGKHAAEGVTADKLSPRMLEALAKGEDPETAYIAEKNAQLEKELQALRQKQENAQRTAGSMKGSAPAPVQSDLLAGFFGN